MSSRVLRSRANAKPLSKKKTEESKSKIVKQVAKKLTVPEMKDVIRMKQDFEKDLAKWQKDMETYLKNRTKSVEETMKVCGALVRSPSMYCSKKTRKFEHKYAEPENPLVKKNSRKKLQAK